MVCEALGSGPQYYCIMCFVQRGFAEWVFLLIHFLHHHKIYFYPNFGLPLRGPFDQYPWTRKIGVAMSKHIRPLAKRPLMCHTCDSCFCDHVMEGLLVL